jgi:hypothetical protein
MVGALKGKFWVIAAAALTVLFLFYFVIPAENSSVSIWSSVYKLPHPLPAHLTACEQPLNGTVWEFVSERDKRNLRLTDEQCQVGLCFY